MAVTIKIKTAATSGVTPTALEYGELAINQFTGVLYYKHYHATTPTIKAIGSIATVEGAVLLTGTQTITGAKTFNSTLTLGLSSNNDGLKLSYMGTAAADAGAAINFETNDLTSGSRTGTGNARIKVLKENATDADDAVAMTFWTQVNDGTISERVRINSSGNVGIGTTSPGEKLNISGGSIRFDGTNNYVYLQNGNSDSSPFLASVANVLATANYGWGFFDRGTEGNFQLQYRAGSTSWNPAITVLRTTGNVGIGTTAPNKLLTLVRADTGTSIGSGKLLRVLSANAVNAHSTIGFGWNSHATNADPVIIGYKITSTTGSGQGNFYIANRNGTTEIEPTEVFTILPDGNVGIGTTSASNKLHIQETGTGSFTGLRIGKSGDTAGDIAALVFQMSSNQTGEFGGKIGAIRQGASSRSDMFFSVTSDAGTLTERMRITKDGNVGIGTTTPLARLQVSSSGAAIILDTAAAGDGRMEYKYNGTRKALIGVDSDNLQIAVDTGNYLQFRTNNSERVRIANDGNVGIGTAAPGTAFEIASTNISIRPTASIATINSNFGAANGSGGYDSLVLANGGTDPTTGIRGSALSFKAATYGGTAGYSTGRILSYFDTSGAANPGYSGAILALQYPTADNTFATGLALRNGNVGIGTAAPGAKLAVVGTPVNMSSATHLGVYGTADLFDTIAPTGSSVGNGGILTFSGYYDGGSTRAAFAAIGGIKNTTSLSQANGALVLYTSLSGTALAERMRIDNSGNVGIGTAAPLARLNIVTAAQGEPPALGAGATGSAFIIGSTTNAYGLYTGVRTSGDVWAQVTRSDSTASVYNLLLQPSGGFVGIGTISPAYPLHVVGGSNIIRYDRTSVGSFNAILSGQVTGSAVDFLMSANQASSGFLWRVSNASNVSINALSIDRNGNVGIGTTAPLLKLDVAGSGRFTGASTSVLTGTIDAIASATVTGVGTLFLTELVVGDRITITGETRTVTAIASNTSLTVDAATTDTDNDTSVDKLAAIFVTRLSSNTIGMVQNDLGNLGIGTAAPADKLHINAGDLRIGQSNSLTDTITNNINFVNTNVTNSPIAVISVRTGAATSNSNLIFQTAVSGTPSEKMRIAGDGNVGIGTAAPVYKLDVTGTGRFTSTLLVSGATTIASSLTVTGTPANLGRYTTFSAGGVQTNSFNDNSATVFPFVARNTQAVDGSNFGTGYGFTLGYGGTQTADGTSVPAGDIAVAQETTYTSSAITQDSFMRFRTSLDGVVAEKMRITSTGNVSIAGDLTTTVGGAAGTGTQTMATRAYLGSRGMNLVVNGTGFLGNNYNFSGLTFDQTDAFTGKGSFRALHGTVASTVISNESISVDPDKTHLLTVYAKTTQFTSISTLYTGIESRDIDNLSIYSEHIMRRNAPLTDTRLLAPLAANDMVIVVTTAPTSWYQAAWVSTEGYKRAIILWGYKNSFGYTYPDYTYSRYWISDMYMSSNSVSQLVLTSAGSGYTTNGTYSLTFTPVSGGTGAAGSYVVLGGVVVSVYITADGSGYIAAPTVSFTFGGTPTAAAAATAKITSNATTSTVEYLVKGVSGSGYTSNPTVTISLGGGTGATATATIAAGVVDRIILTNQGSGFTSNPTVTISGGGGTGATAYATIGTGIDQTNFRIYLRNPFVPIGVATWPIGSALSNGNSGQTYKYIGATGNIVPTTWTKFEGKIGGIDLTGLNASTNNQFRPGTAAVSIIFLPNQTSITNCVISTTVSTAGSGYTSIPTLTFGSTPTAGSLTATGSAVMRVVSVAIAAGGANYAVGNIITVFGGTGTAATFQVTVVTSGAVTTLVALNTGGAYTVLPTLTAVVTTANPAGGTGLTLNLSMGIGSVTILTTGSGYSSSTSKVLSATISSGGTGYAVNDILTVTGGTSTTVATFTVNTVSAGIVTAVTFQVAGVYTFSPHNPAATTGGTGFGCTLIVTWEGPVLTAYSLSGTGATFQVTRGNNAQNYSDISFTEVADRNVATFQPLLTTEVGLNVKLLTSQTAAMQEWQNSSGTALASIGTSGQFLAGGVGSAAFPGIAFQDDTNTGMWRSAADTLQLVTNGVARVTIDSAGNLNGPAGAHFNISPASTYSLVLGGNVSTAGSTTTTIGGAIIVNGAATLSSSLTVNNSTAAAAVNVFGNTTNMGYTVCGVNLRNGSAPSTTKIDFYLALQNNTGTGGESNGIILSDNNGTNARTYIDIRYNNNAPTIRFGDSTTAAYGGTLLAATFSGTLSAGVSTFYASGASNQSTSTGTNWLRSPKNTVTAFIGDTDSTSAYTASEFSGNLRFNGLGVSWGDFGYYPTGGVSGTTNFGHFRFSLAGQAVATTPNAWVSAGVFIAATGFRVSNSVQTAANYLRSNGTDFVSAALAATDLTGTVAAARLPAFTGDVTSTVGTVALAISSSYTASLRAGYTLSGGGTITYDSSSYLLWSTRIIVISNGRGSHFSTAGYFDIDCPTSGTITGVGGTSFLPGGTTNATATSAGIPIGNWYALYYILPIGSGNASVAANFRIVGFSSDLVIPEYWVLLAVQNNDGAYIKLFNAQSLKTGQSYNTTLGTTSATNLIAGTVATARLGSGTASATTFLRGDNTWATPAGGSSVGIVPVGTVLSWLKSFTNTPALATEFVECNGQTLSASTYATSPYYPAGVIPDLNGFITPFTKRFLRGAEKVSGATVSGGTGGGAAHDHTITTTSSSISITSGPTAIITSVSSPTGSTSSTLPPYYDVVWIMRVM